jgi:eukaryotic-like serine/threonine-protein kinase
VDGHPTLLALTTPGSTISGKYTVESVIGKGGMGLVLACWQAELGRRVAIKILHEGSPIRVARFLREARHAARIESEHVARVLDSGTAGDGIPFIVLEYLQGTDLAAELHAKGKLPITEAVGYLLQACEAVAEAHERGIVHRDLKPSNLFLAQRIDGSTSLKVLDFGISKAVDDGAAKVTETGALLGTPRYMSPEQVRDPRDVDARSDVWALGIICYQLVTGSLPFTQGNLPSLSAAIVTEPPRALRELLPDAPEALERVILRCLAKDASERFQSVAELARALEPFGPEEARGSVRRIAKLSGSAFRRRNAAPAAAQTLATADSRGDGSLDPASLQPATPRARRAAPLVVIGAGAVAIGLWFAARSSSVAPVAPAPAATPVAPAPAVAPAASFERESEAQRVIASAAPPADKGDAAAPAITRPEERRAAPRALPAAPHPAVVADEPTPDMLQHRK